MIVRLVYTRTHAYAFVQEWLPNVIPLFFPYLRLGAMHFGDGTNGGRDADRCGTLVKVSRCRFLGLIYFRISFRNQRTQSLSWVKRLRATHQGDEGTQGTLTYFDVIG